MCPVCSVPLKEAATGRPRRFCSTTCRVRALRDGQRVEIESTAVLIESLAARLGALKAERTKLISEAQRAAALIETLTSRDAS